MRRTISLVVIAVVLCCGLNAGCQLLEPSQVQATLSESQALLDSLKAQAQVVEAQIQTISDPVQRAQQEAALAKLKRPLVEKFLRREDALSDQAHAPSMPQRAGRR